MLWSWQEGVVAIVQHGYDASYDVVLRNEAQVSRVDGVILVNGLQPVVVGLGTVDESWHDAQSCVRSDGIARDGLAAGYHQTIGRNILKTA